MTEDCKQLRESRNQKTEETGDNQEQAASD
jgi:hypothetical protein